MPFLFTRILVKMTQEESVRLREKDVKAEAEEQRETGRCYTAGFEDKERSHEPGNAGGL